MAITQAPVLVTGVTGFLGAEVVRQLLEEGYVVRGTTRDLKSALGRGDLTSLPGASGRLELVEADLLDEGSWSGVVEGCEYVLHVASPYQLDVDDPQHDLVDPAVNGTLCVLRACDAAGKVRRLVLTSSYAAITGSPENNVYTEEDWNTEATLEFTSYAYSKTVAERAAWDFMESSSPDFDLVAMNPTGVIGPSIVPRVNQTAGFFIGMTNGAQPAIVALDYPFVDVRDVARAHILAMETPDASGRYLLAAGNLSLQRIADLGREVLGTKYKLPRFALDRGIGVSLSRAFVIFQPKGERDVLKTILGRSHRVDDTKVRTELGQVYRDLDQTVRDIWANLDQLGLLGRKVNTGDWAG